MQHATLGRTGIEVSVAGLGCGGHSRLGQSYGATEAQSVAVIHQALDLGINLIDTAQAYGTESIVGKALRGRHDEVVLSTKALPVHKRPPAQAEATPTIGGEEPQALAHRPCRPLLRARHEGPRPPPHA